MIKHIILKVILTVKDLMISIMVQNFLRSIKLENVFEANLNGIPRGKNKCKNEKKMALENTKLLYES